ncbi:MAG TPA: sugar phosphate isomerase/epimerase family protein [Methanomassiliicoccales archaeon]|jgi:sugar phosphate isomerase/epimerase|nr:sugar phosphate isomerase/epimerase family protein [Methanomassiliicoccales archaeon]
MFGIPALIEYTELRPNLNLCRELGMDFLELNMNLPYSFPENISSPEIRGAMREGLRFSMHLYDELDLGSLQPSVREGHMRRCREALRWGSRHGVFLLNLHMSPGVYFTLPDGKEWVYERYLEEHIGALNASLSELSALAEPLGMRICLENTGHFALPFMRRAAEAVLDLPSVGLCWDIGHDARSGQREEAFMLAHLDRVWHMHFHDWDGRSDHQLPFTGRLDCDRYMHIALENAMSVLIEVKTEGAIRAAVRTMRERGYLPAPRSEQ